MDSSSIVLLTNNEKKPSSTTARRRRSRRSSSFRRSSSHSASHSFWEPSLEQQRSTCLSTAPLAMMSLDASSSKKSMKKMNSTITTTTTQPLPLTMRKGITTTGRRITKRKPIDVSRRRSTDTCKAAVTVSAESTDDSPALSSSDSADDLDPIRGHFHVSFKSAATCRRRMSLCDKYEPRVFEDIIGHEINIKALSNAIHMGKIAHLYLFHGPGGIGKTSTAKVFAMASNCESNLPSTKPCWSCRGCSRSLYITELCSGSRSSGFQRIRTLLQNTKFAWSIAGFKVFIIEECHMLAEEAWEELLSIVEGGKGSSSMVFFMITEHVDRVPGSVLSRCQKFSFQKVRDMDITLKLAKIVAQEGINIGRDALRLITTKADGSLREAENILDQLALIGSRITTSMAQQLVGLVPHNKLTGLLDTAMSADATKTVRCTSELIASGVKPQVLLSQLASLITDILSETPSRETKPSRNQLQFMHYKSASLCHALKILVETDKQLPLSSDHATWVVAALLQIASYDNSNRISTDILLPKDIVSTADRPDDGSRRNSTDLNYNGPADLVWQRKTRSQHMVSGSWQQPNINVTHNQDASNRSHSSEEKGTGKMIEDMEMVWQDILGRIQSQYLKEFLSRKAKLISLTVSRANAIVHLVFEHVEDKLAAEISEETISKALNSAFGCPVTVNMSLQPPELEVVSSGIAAATGENQVADTYHPGQLNCSVSELPRCSTDGQGFILKRCTSQKSACVSENNSLRPTRYRESMQAFQEHEASTNHSYQMPAFSGLLTQGNDKDNEDPERDPSGMDRNSLVRARRHRHQWLSLSSIQQADVSVEPYSQDLLFENAKKDGQQGLTKNKVLQRSLSQGKVHHQHSSPKIGLNRSRSCTDMLCRGKMAELKGGTLVGIMGRCLLRWTTCRTSSSSPTGTNKKTQVDLRKTMPASSTGSL